MMTDLGNRALWLKIVCIYGEQVHDSQEFDVVQEQRGAFRTEQHIFFSFLDSN